MSKRPSTGTSAPPRTEVCQLAEELRTLGSLPEADTAALRHIAETGRLVTVPQGWSLMWERTPADKAYVILEGEVDIRVGDEIVARLGAGEVVGELAIVNRRLRAATVVAATPLRVLHFTRESVEQLYAGVPAFRAALDRAAGEHAA